MSARERHRRRVEEDQRRGLEELRAAVARKKADPEGEDKPQ